MKKILLTYSTVDGHTKTICEKILSYSETSQVDILPIDSSINIKDYDTVVIVASIRYGKYREEIFEFIKENEELLNSKDNAFFSVNVVARKENKNKPETNPYLPPLSTKILQGTSTSQQGLSLWKVSLKKWLWIRSVEINVTKIRNNVSL